MAKAPSAPAKAESEFPTATIGVSHLLKPGQEVVFRPQPRQELFLSSPAFEGLFGGALGGGKSTAILYGSTRYYDRPSYRALILRKTFPELRELMDEAVSIFPSMGGRWVASEKRFVFPSGATIEFGYCETYAEVLQYRGQQYQYIAYDEVGDLVDERVWTFLLTRLRNGKDPDMVKMARCTANPGGAGEPWLMARFIDKCGKDGELYVDPETGNTRCFVQSKLQDNPELLKNDPEYARRLLVLSSTERKQLLDGHWGLGSVKAFPSLTEHSHVVKQSPVPDYAQCFGGFDWGFGHRWSFSVAYGRPGGKLRIVDSCGGRKQTPDVIVDRIRDLLTSRKLKISSLNYTVAGSDVKIRDEARGAYGPSVMEQFGVAGLWLLGADQSRIAGYQNLLRYIDHRLIEWEDTPGNHMVIATLRRMVTDPDNPNDVLKVDTNPLTGEGGDDDYDQTRYLAMSRPIASVEPVQTSAVEQRVKKYMQKKPERDPRAIRMPRTLSLNAGTRTLKVA